MAKAKKLCSWDCEPARHHTLFTEGNVNEVLPGVTTPLYADLASWWDYYWVAGILDVMGVRDMVDIAPPPRFNQLGFMGGRWAVNISVNLEISATWATGDGSAMLQSFFEGGDQIVAGQTADKARGAAARAAIMDRWQDIRTWLKREDRITRRAEAATRRRRLHAVSDQGIVDLVDENIRRMGKSFESHYFVTVGGGEYASLLGALLAQYIKRPRPEWVTMLTSGLRDVESSRPGKAIWDLSRIVVSRPSLRTEFEELEPADIVIRLAAPPTEDWAALADAYRAFMAEFGWRGQRESDPATPTWDESPWFVLTAIKSDLSAPPSASPHVREERAARQRDRLEQRIFSRIPRAARADFRKQLKLTQTLAREREGMKATWARESRNFRPLALEMGRRLATRGVIDERDDVWFLRWAEFQQAGAGKLTGRVKRSVASRKEEYERLKGFIMPDGVFTWPADLVPLHGKADTSQREFQALAVSPGVVTGKARVILDAYEDAYIEPGEILVAPVTDAPWTPLFVPAAAVVVEMGGVLSHAATVAREFGIPAVSGVKDATRIIKTGQVITVNGNTGSVTIVSG